MAELRIGDHTIRLSSRDRVVFPEVGITKGDVIEYYHRIAGVMLPHLEGRPITMLRHPKGLAKRGFFHKHTPKYFPDWIERVRLGSKTPVDYPLCELPEALVYMANQNTIEVHVWTARRDRPAYPDQVVFDLDPPEGRFDMVREAALGLRSLLIETGLEPFVKTTGSKGLHVLAPLDRCADTEAVAGFAARAARVLVERLPEICTVEFYKEDREGKLFVDTLRNAYGATYVAPYSLRARPRAPVSAPIAWDEVSDPGLEPDGISMPAAIDRVDQMGDLWADLQSAAGAVEAASARLEQLS